MSRKELSIKIDYLSIVFENYTAEECIYEIIGLPFIYFQVQEARIKHQDYTSLYQFGTIKIYGDRKRSLANPEGKGCYLVLTGSGCDDYYSYLCTIKHSYSDFFRRCQKKAETNYYHLTRVDVAIDDRNEIPYFTIEQIKKKCLQEEFVSKSRSYRFYDKDKERCRKQGIPYEEMESWKTYL